jgi:hypothetical protein
MNYSSSFFFVDSYPEQPLESHSNPYQKEVNSNKLNM